MGFRPPTSTERDLWMPHFEVRENGSSLRIVGDLPGIARDDLDVSVSGTRLIVSGHREAEERGKDEHVQTYEREYGAFTRTFVLPETCEIEQISSELRDGVLTIVVPLKEAARARKIPIGGAAPKH
jgi:HSP20 family protein